MATIPTEVAEQPMWILDELAYVRVEGEQTRGALAVVELAGRHADMSPLHIDHRNDETVYVVAGQITLFVGDRRYALGERQTAVAPRGAAHAYRIESEQARWLVIASPAGFERFMREASQPAPAAELPPPGRSVDPGAVMQLAADYGIEVLGPPGTLPGDTER